jgi:hypothetical protein
MRLNFIKTENDSAASGEPCLSTRWFSSRAHFRVITPRPKGARLLLLPFPARPMLEHPALYVFDE